MWSITIPDLLSVDSLCQGAHYIGMPADIEFSPHSPNMIQEWILSISSDDNLKCPIHGGGGGGGVAMKRPHKKEWIEALFKHLDSNNEYGSFGIPQIPPPDVTVLNLVLALKHKLDKFAHLIERKVHLCVNGSQQIEGLDYEESYAPTVLAMSIWIVVACACEYLYLGLTLWHLDISNAFQGTKAEPVDGKFVWLCIFPEYLEWFKQQHLQEYKKHKDHLYMSSKARDLACKMMTHFQGCVDTSSVFGKAIADVLTSAPLLLVPNRMDQCVYLGRHADFGPIIVVHATNDMLIAATKEGYEYVAGVMNDHWKVHMKGLVSFSEDAISLDQHYLAFQILANALGPNWQKQPTSKWWCLPMVPNKDVLEGFETCEQTHDW